jgi:hypothetical protein
MNCSRRGPIFVISRPFSKQRQTARQQPIEVRITYPFHPRRGEMVPVFRRFAYHGVDLVVIPQPDGSVACIPEWMTHEQAAHIKLSSEPHFSLENLRSLRTEIDAVLVFLSSDSTKGRDAHAAKDRNNRKVAARTIRSGQTERLANVDAECAPGHACGGTTPRDRRSARNRGGRR